jgi:hypothetical protein
MVKLGDHRPVFAQFLFTFDTQGYKNVDGEGHLQEPFSSPRSFISQPASQGSSVSNQRKLIEHDTPTRNKLLKAKTMDLHDGFGTQETTARS